MISTRKGKPPPPRKKSKTIITAIPCWCLAILCVWTIISQWFYYHSTYNNNCPIDEKDICFVTCIFGDSVDQVDHPANVEWFANHWCNTRFFLVTNLPTLPAPGWTMLQLSSSPLKNKDAVVSQDEYIVQSRYAKFLGWKVLPISGCQTVIYMDGYLQPKYFTYQKFQTISRSLQGSYWGLSQVKQKYFNGLTMETILNNLVKDGKDTVEHVHTTLAWFQAQEDYQNGMTYYLNKYFAYDPSNLKYQELSTFFWKHYTTYGGLWRDQPLWAYTLHHFNVTPLAMTTKGTITKGGDLFHTGGKLGWGQHVYVHAE